MKLYNISNMIFFVLQLPTLAINSLIKIGNHNITNLIYWLELPELAESE